MTTTWKLTCPNCGAENLALRENIVIQCSIVSCRCTCVNCKQEVRGQQEYWRWLGLTDGPSDELEMETG